MIVNNRLLMIGGWGVGGWMDTIEELDSKLFTWSTLNVRMKTPRAGFSATVVASDMVCNKTKVQGLYCYCAPVLYSASAQAETRACAVTQITHLHNSSCE